MLGPLPSDVAESSTQNAVFILHSSLPGGSSAPYNLGATLTHEIGHALGLLHTFQGGCGAAADDETTSGDCIADTPPEATAAFGDMRGRKSCFGGNFSQSRASHLPACMMRVPEGASNSLLPSITITAWFGFDPVTSYMD